MYEGVSKCVKRPLSDNTSNNMTNSRANIVETNMWPQQLAQVTEFQTMSTSASFHFNTFCLSFIIS